MFAEVEAVARARGSDSGTFAGLAGTGELVTTVGGTDGDYATAGETLPLLAEIARRERVPTPALDRLVALVQGRIDHEQWQAAVSRPSTDKRRPARAA